MNGCLTACITSRSRVLLWLAVPHLHSFPHLYTHFTLGQDIRVALRAVLYRRENPRWISTGLLRNILHDVIQSLPKGVTTSHYGGTHNMVAFVLRWVFNDYYFLVQLFATSLKMAVSNRVESSSAVPRYQSPRRYDSKNTTFHIPAFDSIFSAFFRAAPNSFTSW